MSEEKLKKYNLLVGAICKNNAKHMPNVLTNIEQYAKLFSSCRTLIIDGHSTDGTYEIVKEWCKKDSKHRDVYKQPLNYLSRSHSLTEGRNMVVILFEKYFQKNTYLLLLDTDEVNAAPVDINSFLTNFDYSTDTWDAMFANQSKNYYDIWALRSKECPYDCWQMVRQFGNQKEFVDKHQKHYPISTPIEEVDSAFGGSGLYHTEKLTGCRYAGYINHNGKSVEICEHVPFHSEFKNKGAKLFINFAWINH